MKSPGISVVIPCYNAASTISECVESILHAAEGYEVEIICVDDGSKDNTVEICNNLASSHPQVKLVTQINSGPSAARCEGVRRASFDWIMFVDADDTVTPNAFNDLLKTDEDLDKYDIVVGNKKDHKGGPCVIGIEQYRIGVLKKKVPPYPWGKLLRKSLFDDHTFDLPRDLIHGEDLIMNVRLAFNSVKPVLITNKKVYNYRFVTTSLSHTFRYSPDFELVFDRELKRSIKSDDPVFQHIHISMRIKAWKRINRFCLSTRKNRDSEFYRTLCSDLKESEYKLSLSERYNIFFNDYFSRSLIILVEHFPHYLEKKIKALKRK